jgi:hypothetical protein
MTIWTKSKAFRKWSGNVKTYRRTRRSQKPSELDMCTKKDFCKGSKDIPRKLMPQIYDAAKFSKIIKDKYDVDSHREKMAMATLRPSQNEINAERVDSVIEDIKARKISHKNPIVISEDGYIVDGHHRWAAYKKYNPDHKIPVLVIEVPIKDALGLAATVVTKREEF